MEIKEKEKQFYTAILENFLSKINKNKAILIGNFNFHDYSNENFRIYHGVTKLVLVPKNKGARYVIKIPLIREADCDWCEAEVIAYQRAVGVWSREVLRRNFPFLRRR